MKKQEQSLVDFNWDDDNQFFGVPATPTEDVIPPTSNNEPEGDDDDDDEPAGDIDPPKGKDTDTDDDDVFFGTPSGNASDDTPPSGDDGELKGDKFWNDVYSDFKEKGLFNHVELEEGEEIDSERLLELQQQEYQAEVQARLTNWAQNDLDEDAQAFIKFKTQGGSTQDFFKTYQSFYELPTGDIEDEDYQDRVIRYQLKKEGWDVDEVEERLEYLTTSKKKESVAKRYSKKLEASVEEEKQNLIKQVETQKQIQKQQEETFKSTLKDTLSKTQEVRGFKITTKDQANLYNLLTRKQYKTESGNQITGFQKKIGEAFQDPEKMILLAKLLDSDFDMTSFERKATTQTAKKIKSKLEQHRGTTTNSGSSLGGGGSLADFFKN